MSDDAIAHATFTRLTEVGRNTLKGTAIPVQFNPASLQYTVTNTLKEERNGNTNKQFVSQSSGKLTMDLVFDTTHLRKQDVRILTEPLAKFMEPIDGPKNGGKGDNKGAPPVVEFEWGTYVFRGMFESYKETLDFFSADGVPQRATVSLSLARQDKVFETRRQPKPDEHPEEPVELPIGRSGQPGLPPPGGGGQFATQLGASAGDVRAGRLIAAVNGEESMRFSASASLTVDAGIEIAPPVAFASGGASAGGGISGGIGVSAGAGASAGGRASAGVSASAGAFAGLRATSPARVTLDVERLVRRSETVSLGVDDTASFSLGGQASPQGSASLSMDVGPEASLRSRIQFQEE
jgi:hypothetical protein